jgi:outer membrane protein OmpA-like peptidoglycan-associated protein
MRQISASLLACACALLGACAQAPKAPPTLGNELVVVLPGHDGKVGGVVVRRAGAEQVLDQPYAAARIVAESKPRAAQLTAVDVTETFGPALSALPGKPATFLVYFLEGKDELTAASIAELKDVFAEIKRRPEPDLLVIGHTDNVGSDGYNDKLSLARAERVRELLMGLGIPAARIQTAGRGKREALVPTLNNVSEPRNRRVEISVR